MNDIKKFRMCKRSKGVMDYSFLQIYNHKHLSVSVNAFFMLKNEEKWTQKY